jgi:hypothetical protein
MADRKDTPEQNPQKGGSYTRQPDGSLQLDHATQPAQPALNTEAAGPVTTSEE